MRDPGKWLENAIHACQKNEAADAKWIKISVAAHENGVITLKIENPCQEDIAFGPGRPAQGQAI